MSRRPFIRCIVEAGALTEVTSALVVIVYALIAHNWWDKPFWFHCSLWWLAIAFGFALAATLVKNTRVEEIVEVANEYERAGGGPRG
jgi:hypothetical protein